MKVVHICLACFYPDNFSYQENMLPKFHKKLGYDVEVIASLQTFDKNGKVSFYDEPKKYINEYGILVTRIGYKQPEKIYRKMKRFVGLIDAFETAKPDILFIHGLQFLDIDVVVQYLKKHAGVKTYVDNHADFSNSATNWVSLNVLHKIVWKRCARKILPYVKKFYGVLPARVNFLKKIYGLPDYKCELLVMGADDDLVVNAAKPEVTDEIRKQYDIAPDDFLVMTGGKIDAWKAQTLFLIEAIKKIGNPKVRLIMFGSVTQELKNKVETLVDGKKVQFIGWVQSSESYKYFAAADLVVFPGRHSVFWEQVTGQGIPMLCKEWTGTTHVDLGGNVKFLTKDSADEIKLEIENLLNNQNEYSKMKQYALEKGMKTFSYYNIAKRAIEC